jgi:hypothetical protein
VPQLNNNATSPTFGVIMIKKNGYLDEWVIDMRMNNSHVVLAHNWTSLNRFSTKCNVPFDDRKEDENPT